MFICWLNRLANSLFSLSVGFLLIGLISKSCGPALRWLGGSFTRQQKEMDGSLTNANTISTIRRHRMGSVLLISSLLRSEPEKKGFEGLEKW